MPLVWLNRTMRASNWKHQLKDAVRKERKNTPASLRDWKARRDPSNFWRGPDESESWSKWKELMRVHASSCQLACTLINFLPFVCFVSDELGLCPFLPLLPPSLSLAFFCHSMIISSHPLLVWQLYHPCLVCLLSLITCSLSYPHISSGCQLMMGKCCV